MDINARVYQKALQTLGAINGQEVPPKRKLNDDTSRRSVKAARPSTFLVEPVVLKQLEGGKVLFCFVLVSLWLMLVATQYINGLSTALSQIHKRMSRLSGLDNPNISSSLVVLERQYRHDIISTFNEIRGRIQVLQATRDLYISALDAIDQPQ